MRITLDVNTTGRVEVIGIAGEHNSETSLLANMIVWAVEDRIRPVTYDRIARDLREAFEGNTPPTNVKLGPSDWSTVLYALSIFILHTPEDTRHSRKRAQWILERIDAQVR